MKLNNNLFDINPILKITKKVTNNTDNFNNYYHNKSNSLYIKQLPYIISDKFKNKNFNFQNLKIKNPLIKTTKDENIKNNNNNNHFLTYSNFNTNEYFKSLDKLRKVTNRSKKIPILCPLFNNQGELIPNSIITNKIFPTGFQKISNEFNNYNNTIGYFPLNKYKLKDDFNSVSVSSNNVNIEKDFIENFFENKINNKISIYDILKSNNENIINKKIEKIKNEKITNLTTKLEKNLIFQNENKAIIQLKSIIIIFEEIDDKNESKNLKKNEIILPFDLIPLFYFKNIEYFKEILISLIKFDDNFDKISIDEEEIYSIIKNEENIETNEKEKIFNETKETEENNNNENENKINLKLVNKQDLNNLFSNLEKKYKIKNYEQFPNEKKISKNNFNIYKFNWNTPKKNFKVSIQLPLIIFNITNKKIIINKFIDKKLLFFLFSNNFLDFDYYCISYLLTFKKFRNILQKLTNHQKNKIFNQFLFILPPKIFEDDENNISIKNVYTIIDKNNKINFLYEIKNFYLKVFLIDDLNLMKKNYKIYFNFKQIKKFRKLENFIDIINVFILFLNINNNNVKFDYEKFNDFDEENWIKEIKKYNSKNYFIFRNEKNNKNKIEYNLNEKIHIKIEFNKSILNEINFDGKGNKIQKSQFIDNNLERKIYNNNENFEKLFENINKSEIK